uniref:Uncharacterized protein n=1 Tax=Arundo donax TaxID=35708 RepID=A0A0A9CEJ9_ARUDO
MFQSKHNLRDTWTVVLTSGAAETLLLIKIFASRRFVSPNFLNSSEN